MSDEMAQKVGRGGAGNFYRKADIDNALHTSRPPQKSSSSPPRMDTQSESTTSHTGRGGIGNYIAPSQELPTSSSDAQSDPQPAKEALDASKAKPKDKVTGDKNTAYRGQSGRGGAGNWKQGNEEAERKKAEDKEMKVKSRIDESIRLDVEKGLKPPPKAYSGPENVFGRGG